jgi:hypothetical protein
LGTTSFDAAAAADEESVKEISVLFMNLMLLLALLLMLVLWLWSFFGAFAALFHFLRIC